MEIDRPELRRAIVGEHFHLVEKIADAVGFAQISRVNSRSSAGRRLDQLRRAPYAGQRFLISCASIEARPDTERADLQVGELPVQPLGSGALEQHHEE